MLYLLHQIVDRSALQLPDKSAFVYDGDSITYSSLAHRSNGVAQALIDKGVKKGDRVGLLLPKSLNLPVALYGVLKAGAVIVPIDPQAPPERIALVLQDANIQHLITAPTQHTLVERLCERDDCRLSFVLGLAIAPTNNCQTLAFDDIEPSATCPSISMVEDDPAYLLFTSGSTGQPKGILHSHRSGLAYAKLAAATYELNEHDRLGNFAPLHFDQSTFDFYAGPLRGATTVLIPQAFGVAIESLATLMAEERITIWYSVPSVLIALVTKNALAGKDLSALRWVLFGGEPFPPKHLRKLIELLPSAQFSNVYGPTEVNQCTYYNLTSLSDGQENIPIGRTWGNTESLVVDEHEQQVEPGEIGELLIRSPTMMLGYWRQPALNAAGHYVRTETSGATSRFYRTGDLVRLNSYDNLEFVGRRDRQIKSRGFRVELDEIENVLCRHSHIAEAGSYTVEHSEHGQVIEAAVVEAKVNTQPDTQLTERALSKHCAKYLPAYARPSRIYILLDMPRTRTGKIDRNALARNTNFAPAPNHQKGST